MSNKYKTIFISDIHLGISAWQSDVLNKWLKNNKAEIYYLIGDIADLWKLRRSWYWPESHNKLIRRFIKIAEKRDVYYLLGNHDRSFNDFVGLNFGGIEIKNEMIHTTVKGLKFLIIHGDKFDTIVRDSVWLAHIGSIGYEFLFKLNRIVTFLRRTIGLRKYWSLSAAVKQKVKKANKYITRFEETLIEYTKQQKLHGCVCGHIHKANIEYKDDIMYLNCGDFIESMTLLVEHFNGEFEIISFDQTPTKKDLNEIDD